MPGALGMRAPGREEVQDRGSPDLWRSQSLGSRCPGWPPAPRLLGSNIHPPSPHPSALRRQSLIPHSPLPPSVRVRVWVVCQERYKAGVWVPAGAVGFGWVRGARSVPLVNGLGGGGLGGVAWRGLARPGCFAGPGGAEGAVAGVCLALGAALPGETGTQGGSGRGGGGQRRGEGGQRQKPTARGIPRRSPMQVLTRPDPA